MPRGTITERDEVFGPVIPLYRFHTEEEVIKLANNVDVGLGAFVMTSSMPRQWRVTEALEASLPRYTEFVLWIFVPDNE
jgi:succinate-semialdehyde dehydrogenase/glutarate-semialdehyde dehydrogenase